MVSWFQKQDLGGFFDVFGFSPFEGDVFFLDESSW